MTTADELQRFLQQLINTSRGDTSLEAFVLANGRTFPAQPLPSPYMQGEKKQCFSNAGELALDHEALEYVEGIAASNQQLPFLHAWCVHNGLVVDPTLDRPETYTYFGVLIPKVTLLSIIEATGEWGVLGGLKQKEFIAAFNPSPSSQG